MRVVALATVVLLVGCSDPPERGAPAEDTGTVTLDATSSGDAATDTGSSSSSDAAVADSGADVSATGDSGTDLDATVDASPSSDVLLDASPDAEADTGMSTPDSDTFVCPPPDYNGEICVTVIVYVRDRDSGTCCQYPTPCHIPEHTWEETQYPSMAACEGR